MDDKLVNKEESLNSVDLYESMVNYIKDSRNKIIDGFNNFDPEENFSFRPSNARVTKAGDFRHHSGINITSKKGEYFIGFTGLNMDKATGNFHSCIGNIQLFVGDGNPNERHKFDSLDLIECNYPDITSTNKVINTGYKLFVNKDRKSKVLLLDKKNLNNFCRDIIKMIEGIELEKEEVKNNDGRK